MRRALITLLAVVLASPAQASDSYAHCILEKMPGVANDASMYAVVRACLAGHPNGYRASSRGAGKGWFSYGSPDECVLKKARATPNNQAGAMISIACHCLYREPDFPGQACAE